MKRKGSQSKFSGERFCSVIAVVCAALLSSISSVALAQTPQAQSQVMTTTKEAPKIPNDQLDSLVAPIALYPDQLLSQTLVASTYPLEIIQLQQWIEKNKNLKDKALASAVEKQNWDPSIQAMAAFPDVVQRLADNVQWTTDLGNAFLAQESDVMDAVQRMRAKAEGNGTLKTSAQQKVESQTVEGGKQVIVVQQASPDVVYVPSYDPTVVYGAPAYPYPPISYPSPGYYAAGAAVAFGTGVALGAAWGGNWGWNCGWGHGDVNVNVNNKYVNNYNKNVNNYNKANFNQANFNKANINSGKWQHNSQHRGGAPYNRASASQVQGQLASRGQGGAGAGNRPGGGAGASNRPGGGGAGQANRPGGGAGNRPGGGGAGANRPGGGGGGERIGGRNVSGGGGSGKGGAFGGGGGGMNRSSAMASHNRGSQSMGAARGGGGRGGGGGGHRGGGGRRR